MAEKRSRGFIQLEWECPNCSSRNPGPVKTCANCGAPQPENVEFVQPTEQKLVTDEKSIEAAKAGADIHCGFCGTRNAATATVCSQCGADLKEGKARQSGRVMQPTQAGPKTVNCTNCGTENPSANTICSKCGAPLPRTMAPQAAPAQMPKATAAPRKTNWLLIGGIAAGLLACCLAVLFIFVFPSASVQATVADVQWQTSVPVQEQSEVRHSDETGSPPSGAYDVSCHTETEQICEQKTVDRGNGYAEIVEECHDQSTEYCSYTVLEWETIQTYTLDGNDLFPVYAEPGIASGQRTGSASESFTVFFETEKGPKTYSPGSLSEFQQFEIGSAWTLKMNRVGAILSVEP
ncbi:MAG: zinc-ribbon domain-containing protein [Chloroflexota bacterium]